MSPIYRILPVLALILGGCASTSRVSFHVDIGDIKIANAALNGDEATFKVAVSNETLFTWVIESDEHKFYIDGTFVGESKSSDSYALPRLGVAERELKVHLADSAAVETVRNAIRKGGAYRVESTFMTNSGGVRDRVNVESTGTFKAGG